MNNGITILTFSETVDASTIDPTQITLQNGFTAAVTHTISDLAYSIVSNEPSPIIIVTLSTKDVNDIKRITVLGTQLNNSFLSFSANFVSDESGNPVVPIPPCAALRAAVFMEDTTPPLLTLFFINITSGILNMTFSETVNILSFRFSSLTLVNGRPMNTNGELQPVSSYTLTGGSLLSGLDDPVVAVKITQYDLDAIFAMGNLATSVSDTYLITTSETVVDMVQNPLHPIPLNLPLQASAYYGTYGT